MKTFVITLELSEDERAALLSYLGDVNSLIQSGNRLLVNVGREPIGEEWTEQALAGLLRNALERERRIQIRQREHKEPAWLRQIMRESIPDFGGGDE